MEQQQQQQQITMIRQLDINRNDNTIKVKVICKWQLTDTKFNNLPYSIELILMDEEGTIIQGNVGRRWFVRFENFLKEGAFLIIRSPSIGINTAKNKYSSNPNKLSLNSMTFVSTCTDFNGPTYGFIFSSFHDIKNKETPQNVTFDVIGHITKFFKFEVSKDDREKARLTMEIEDLERNTLFFTLWDTYAHQMVNHVKANPVEDHIIIVLQFARVKFYKSYKSPTEDPYVSNSFGSEVSRLFINEDIEAINTYKNRLIKNSIENPDSVHRPSGTTIFVSIEEDFLTNTYFVNIGEICEIIQVKSVIIVGKITGILQNFGWHYMGCDKCYRKLEKTYVTHEQDNDGGVFEEVLQCKNPTCSDHVVSPLPIIMLRINVQDVTGAVSLTLWDRDINKFINKSARDLVRDAGPGDNLEIPNEIMSLLGKTFAFKISITEYNLTKNKNVYTITKLTDDPNVISQLQRRFNIGQSDESESVTPCMSEFATHESVLGKEPVSCTGDNVTPLSKIDDIIGSSNFKDYKSSKAVPDDVVLKRKLDDIYDLDESSSMSATKSAVEVKNGKAKQVVVNVLLKPKVEK